MPEAPKFTAGLSISCMTVPLWLARFWQNASSNEMMGSVDFLGGCPAGSHLKSSRIEHCHSHKDENPSNFFFSHDPLVDLKCPNFLLLMLCAYVVCLLLLL